MPTRHVIFALVATLGVVGDQLTKSWVVRNLEVLRDEIVVVPNLVSIVHAQNTGAAFSMMDGQLGLFLIITVIGVALVIGFQFGQRAEQLTERQSWFTSLILGMILGGILGNGIDRLLQGRVTDMVKCYWGFEPGRSWLIDQVGTNVYPIWNVADALLVVGVIAFLVGSLLQRDADPLLVDDEGGAEATPGSNAGA